MTGSGELRALHARNAIQAAPAARIVFLTAAIYFLFGRLGLALAILPGNETLILPAAGIALAAAILRGRDARLGVFLGAFLLDISSHADFDDPKSLPLAVALAMAIGAIASAQAAIGAWLVRRSRAFPIAPATPMSVALLFALGGVVAGLIGATLCLCLFRAAGRVASGDLLQFWAVQSGGEAVGVIVQTPLILSFAGAPAGQRWRRAAPIAAAGLATFAATVALMFADVRSIQQVQAADFSALSRELASRIVGHRRSRPARGRGPRRRRSRPRTSATSTISARPPNDSPRSASAYRRWNGSLGWGWTTRAAFESRMTRAVGDEFQHLRESRDGKPARRRAAGRTISPSPIVTPLKGNEGAVGFDLASNPARNAALVAAEATGGAIATRRRQAGAEQRDGHPAVRAGLRRERADRQRRRTTRQPQGFRARRVFGARICSASRCARATRRA